MQLFIPIPRFLRIVVVLNPAKSSNSRTRLLELALIASTNTKRPGCNSVISSHFIGFTFRGKTVQIADILSGTYAEVFLFWGTSGKLCSRCLFQTTFPSSFMQKLNVEWVFVINLRRYIPLRKGEPMNKLSADEIPTLTVTEQKSIYKLKERLSEIFHLRSLILFGSKARGDYEESSDVDVLVLVDDDKDWSSREKLSDITFEINLEYDTQFTCILENSKNWEEEGIWLPLKDNIVREGIVIEV